MTQPAVHHPTDTPRKRIFDAERCEASYEQAEADRIREAWDGPGAHQRAAARAMDRASMTLAQRLAATIHRLQLASGVNAGQIAREPGATDGHPSALLQLKDGDDPTQLIEQELRLIESLVERAEHAVDVHLGLARPDTLDADERDRVVWEEYQGIRSDQVAQAAPWLGASARTIERARAREAVRRRVKVRQVDGVVLRQLTGEEIARLDQLETDARRAGASSVEDYAG